uniref:Xylosyltransferase 1-like n=1 Tax=Rhizophora mucronata TaxID=61149 RepID=A0A2P2NQG6_RHIMU
MLTTQMTRRPEIVRNMGPPSRFDL